MIIARLMTIKGAIMINRRKMILGGLAAAANTLALTTSPLKGEVGNPLESEMRSPRKIYNFDNESLITFFERSEDVIDSVGRVVELPRLPEHILLHGIRNLSPTGDRVVFAASEFKGNYTGKYRSLLLSKSVDGNFVYTHNRKGVYSQDLAIGEITELVPEDGICQGPGFSPDGSKIAYYFASDTTMPCGAGKSALYIADADGSNRRELAPESKMFSHYDFTWLRYKPPIWSTDGSYLYFVASYDEKVEDIGFQPIYRIGIKGGTPEYILNGYISDFSNDGKEICGYSDNIVGKGRRIFVCKADGSELKYLCKGTDPKYSPSGRLIAFRRKDGLYLINVDGSGVKKIADIEEMGGNKFYWQGKKANNN